MKAFDPNYKLLDEMYQDDYYPAFLVNKVQCIQCPDLRHPGEMPQVPRRGCCDSG